MIILKEATKATRTTTLNEIPVGQAFRGRVKSSVGDYRAGLFWKVRGRWSDKPTNTIKEVLVVQLHPNNGNTATPYWFWTECKEVLDYEPVTVELTVQEAKQ
jgi:hypothetical protein